MGRTHRYLQKPWGKNPFAGKNLYRIVKSRLRVQKIDYQSRICLGQRDGIFIIYGKGNGIFAGTQAGYFTKITLPNQNNFAPTVLFADREQLIALGLGVAEKIERLGQILGGQATLFRKTLGGKVIGITIPGNLANLYMALFDASLEIRIGKPKRDTQVACYGSLGQPVILMNCIQQAKNDLCITVCGIMWLPGNGLRLPTLFTPRTILCS